jgi:L-seryl-tRNA(Ser) seleniumtransferase
VLRLLTRLPGAIREQAQRLLGPLRAALGEPYLAELTDVRSQIGSGSLPVDLLDSCAVSIRLPGRRGGSSAAAIARAFRALPIPVIGRVHDGDFLLDLRALEAEADFAAQLPQLRLEPPV